MKRILPICVVLAVVLLTYSNHFKNSFHFDDSHTIVDNPHIRDLRNAGSFFADAQTFSTLPANRTYRPVVSISLAIDYWLGRGLNPFYFHVSTFLWFLAQLVLMAALFQKVFDAVRPRPENRWIALFAVALYGLHPAIAETVNYIIQRGDIFSTVGVIASLVLYIYVPGSRKAALYLVPFAAAVLSKPPAMVFPLILLVYIRLFEEESLRRAAVRCVPAFAAAAILGYLTIAMTPSSVDPGSRSASAYWMTQPIVTLGYFRSFFIPNHLSADTDRQPVNSIFQDGAWMGVIFVAVVIGAAIWASRRREWRPVAFGLWWFLLALVPTAIFPLAEVENDHRMFFPFVGLVLAVCWVVSEWILKLPQQKAIRGAAVGLGLIVLAASASATRQRNEVWRTEESLWLDVTIKHPKNGRGLMNYGLTQMAKADYLKARDYFTQAMQYTPNYHTLEINLGIVNGELNEDAAADRHFARAIALAPAQSESHYFYARWLEKKARWPEAADHLGQVLETNPDYMNARYLMMEGSAKRGDWAAVQAMAEATLARFPSDQTAAGYRAQATSPARPAPAPMTAADYLNLSLSYHRLGKFQESITAATEALKLKPDYAEAYNNIAAAYEGLHMWDPAIAAASRALEIRPDYQLAKNNLQWSLEQKVKEQEGR
jgi:tetratricopeptide (TPR) repeat protein